MAGAKTTPTKVRSDEYLGGLPDQRNADDARTLVTLMSDVTGEPATMWGDSMIGFGSWHYIYESGHKGDTFLVGFAPRVAAFTIYLNIDLSIVTETLSRLGKYKLGKGCLYIKRLSDVDLAVLRELIVVSVESARD